MDQNTKAVVAAALRVAANIVQSGSFPRLSELRKAVQAIAAMPHPRVETETNPEAKARLRAPAEITVSQSIAGDDVRFPVFKVTYSTLRSEQLAALKSAVESFGLEVVEKDITSGRWDWKDIIWLAPKGLHTISKEVRRLRPLDP